MDPEWVEKPRRWGTPFIRSYMVLFGLVSSIFDFLTFGTLLFLFRASPEEFRTGWFIESLLTELVIALVVRTRHLFFRSCPGTLLLVSTLVVIGITLGRAQFIEKRNLGELWAARSGGMGLFSMPRGKDFEAIWQLVRRKLHYESLVTTNNVMSSD